MQKKLQKIRAWVTNRVLEISTWAGAGVALVGAGVIFDLSILAAVGCACGIIAVIREEKL